LEKRVIEQRVYVLVFYTSFFPHYPINGTIFGKKGLLSKEYMFWFSIQVFFPHYPINGAIFGKKKGLLSKEYMFWFSIQVFFPHYPINGTIFGEKRVIEQRVYVLVFYTSFLSALSHKRNDFWKKGLLSKEYMFWFSIQVFFPHYPINGTTCGKKGLLSKEYMFWFSIQVFFPHYPINGAIFGKKGY